MSGIAGLHAARQAAAREQAERQAAAPEQAERQAALDEQAAREQAAREQAAREEAAKVGPNYNSFETALGSEYADFQNFIFDLFEPRLTSWDNLKNLLYPQHRLKKINLTNKNMAGGYVKFDGALEVFVPHSTKYPKFENIIWQFICRSKYEDQVEVLTKTLKDAKDRKKYLSDSLAKDRSIASILEPEINKLTQQITELERSLGINRTKPVKLQSISAIKLYLVVLNGVAPRTHLGLPFRDKFRYKSLLANLADGEGDLAARAVPLHLITNIMRGKLQYRRILNIDQFDDDFKKNNLDKYIDQLVKPRHTVNPFARNNTARIIGSKKPQSNPINFTDNIQNFQERYPNYNSSQINLESSLRDVPNSIQALAIKTPKRKWWQRFWPFTRKAKQSPLVRPPYRSTRKNRF
jgi:hypothetical protein